VTTTKHKAAVPTDVQSLIRHREAKTKDIPTEIGVYALCDLDDVPIYVGQSTDGIRTRVQRHITSARSDVIANRQVDVWEIGWIRCWVVGQKADLSPLESHLFHQFNQQSVLMNGTVPQQPAVAPTVPAVVSVQILPQTELEIRRRVQMRLPRQAAHFASLLDHYLTVKDSKELHRALEAHFARLTRYFAALRPDPQASAESE